MSEKEINVFGPGKLHYQTNMNYLEVIALSSLLF
jgi:hypothetical protein